MTEISSEVRDLLVAIHDLLDQPYRPGGDERTHVMYVVGAIQFVIENGCQPDDVRSATRVFRRRAESLREVDHPEPVEDDDPADSTGPIPARSGDLLIITDSLSDGSTFSFVARVVRVDDAGRVISAHIYGQDRVEVDLTGDPHESLLAASNETFDLGAIHDWAHESDVSDLWFASADELKAHLVQFGTGPAEWHPVEVAPSTWRSA